LKQAIIIIIICLFLSSPLGGISKAIDESNQEITANDNGPMNSAWPTYGQNNQHTGQSRYNTLNNPMDIKWRFQPETSGFESSPVIDKNNVLYILCNDGFLYAINSDGSERWKFNINNWGSHLAALAEDGTIYIGSWDKYLYAIGQDGNLKWKFYANGSIDGSPTIAPDGTIYFGVLGPGNNAGRIYALHPDGTEKWYVTVGDYVYSTPAIGNDGTIYITSNDRYLYALNPENGSILWKFRSERIFSSPSINADGIIYCCSHAGYIYAFYPNGTLYWKTEIDTGSYDTPVIGKDGTIYIGESYFYAINADGSIKWTYKGWNSWEYEVTSFTYAISNDDLIYFIATKNDGGGGDLFCLNSNGILISRKNLASNSPQYCSAVIGDDGTVYIGSQFVKSGKLIGYLYAFGEVENNHPPNKPDINGPITGKINVEYDYIFTVSDIDNDEIFLYVEWGDESSSGWLGPYESDEEIVLSHSWNQQGSYNLKAKTKDEHEIESDWFTLEVTMPKSKISFFFNQCINEYSILRIIFRGII